MQEGMGLMPSQGTKISHATQLKKIETETHGEESHVKSQGEDHVNLEAETGVMSLHTKGH